jgi:hypothetical protein
MRTRSSGITSRGRKLRDELNQALGSESGGDYIPFERLADVSLLARRCHRHNTRQEQACSYEWACGDKWDRDEKRLEASILSLATSLPGIVGVKFSGDPRGYTVKLLLTNGRSNNWGGIGWGVE